MKSITYTLFILLIFSSVVGCSTSKEIFPGSKKTDLEKFNCGGFVLKEIGKADSIEITMNIFDCTFGRPLQLALLPVKYKDKSLGERNLRITPKLNTFQIKSVDNIASISTVMVGYGTVETPFLLFNNNKKYILNVYLPADGPIID